MLDIKFVFMSGKSQTKAVESGRLRGNMAVVKRFYFDGEDMREEKVVEKETEAKTQTQMAMPKPKPKDSVAGVGKKNTAGKGADMGEIRMLVSSLLKKDGKAYARVSFLRGEDSAEGIVPGGMLERVNGFTKEEEAGLTLYLAANQEAILSQAKQIDPLTNWLRMPQKN